jgi:cytochrome bd-type quinol oxidase subunit 2
MNSAYAARIPKISTRRRSAKRRGALLLCAVFVAVSILSAVFVSTHANHEHDSHGIGGACATCAQIATVKAVLKQISIAVAGAVVVAGVLFVIFHMQKPALQEKADCSLVRLKVRLNS